ncbi:unnamed protein product, partial [Ascophyllum nodosum]
RQEPGRDGNILSNCRQDGNVAAAVGGAKRKATRNTPFECSEEKRQPKRNRRRELNDGGDAQRK